MATSRTSVKKMSKNDKISTPRRNKASLQTPRRDAPKNEDKKPRPSGPVKDLNRKPKSGEKGFPSFRKTKLSDASLPPLIVMSEDFKLLRNNINFYNKTICPYKRLRASLKNLRVHPLAWKWILPLVRGGLMFSNKLIGHRISDQVRLINSSVKRYPVERFLSSLVYYPSSFSSKCIHSIFYRAFGCALG